MHPSPIVTLIAFPLWVLAIVGLWRAHRWLPFYVTGALGGVIFVTLFASFTGLSARIEALEASQVIPLARVLGLTLVNLGSNGIAIKNHVGWGVFDIGVECSGLMEMAAMGCLVAFYPAVFTPARKVFIVTLGTVLTYLFNLLRILLIVGVVATLGTDWVFPAHAVFGRMLFFLLTITLYWKLVTMPTVAHVGRSLERRGE